MEMLRSVIWAVEEWAELGWAGWVWWERKRVGGKKWAVNRIYCSVITLQRNGSTCQHAYSLAVAGFKAVPLMQQARPLLNTGLDPNKRSHRLLLATSLPIHRSN
jgi:hypothetical protein